MADPFPPPPTPPAKNLTPQPVFGKHRGRFFQMFIGEIEGVIKHVWIEIEDSKLFKLSDDHIKDAVKAAPATPAQEA